MTSQVNRNRKKLTVSRKKAKILTVNRKSHYPIETLVQNVRDFPQTKLDSEINTPFLLNEHGDPRFFSLVFAKSSLIKNIFEEEKKFDSGTRFLCGK